MDDASQFEVSKLYDGVRADGAPILYILIKPPIDPEKIDYKHIVQGIVKPLIQRLPKFSAYIYDDRQSLVLHFMHYTSQLGHELTNDEYKLLTGHCIAVYDRGLESGTTLNNLAFYPVARKGDKKHAFFEESEYNPEGEGGLSRPGEVLENEQAE